MTHAQRRLFAKGLIDLANIIAGALVFGQLVSNQPLDLTTLALGILFTLTFYLAALGVSKDKRHSH